MSLGGELRDALLLTLLMQLARAAANPCPALCSINYRAPFSNTANAAGSSCLCCQEWHFKIHSTFGGGTEYCTFIYLCLLLFTIMAPKTKEKAPPSIQNRMGTAKSRRSQPPPVLPTPQVIARLGLNEKVHTLKDVMIELGNIKSRLAAHDVRLDEMSTLEVPIVTTDKPQ